MSNVVPAYDSATPGQLLFLAVEENDRNRLVKLILSNHLDPRFVKNDKQETLLHVASKLGHIDMVRTLVEVYLLCPFKVDQCSFTSCHYACQFKHLNVLSYFFQVGGHTYISKFRPFHQNSPLIPEDFALQLLSVAASSGSVVMVRFMCTFLHSLLLRCPFNIHKMNLFLDSFCVIHKIIHPILCYFQTANCFQVIISSCQGEGKLDILKFLMDELDVQNEPYFRVNDQWKKQKRLMYSSLFQDAYRLDNLDTSISDYLTQTKGLSPAYEPSTYNCVITLVPPFNHSHCFQHPYSPLHTAVLSGNISALQTLLAPTTDLFHLTNHLTTEHGTLLHSACVSGSKEMVRFMIQELKCDINAQSTHGNTPLHVACEWGWLEIVQYLLEHEDCNVNIVNSLGYSPFTLTIKHNRPKIFKHLIAIHAIDINTQTTDSLETPLHLACCCDSTEYTFALLDDDRYAYSLDAVDAYGDTPLFNACRLGSKEMIKKLIAKGCNCSFVNRITKETPAHIACQTNQLDVLKLFWTQSVLRDEHFNYLGKSLLHLACENDAEEIVDFLIDNQISTKISIHAVVDLNISPLHIACARGNIKIVRKLLISGICKITDTDKCGNTTLHYLCTRELVDSKMVEIFSEYKEGGELIIKKNANGDNPLHCAFASDSIQVLDCLLKHLNLEWLNKALCSTNNNHSTPLHIAFMEKKVLAMRYVLNRLELKDGISKALCMSGGYSQCSPLHIACINFELEYVKLVLHSPLLSEKNISTVLCLQDDKGDNVFHSIFKETYLSPEYVASVFHIFKAFSQNAVVKIGESAFVSALCMQNEAMNTPVQCSVKNHDDHEILPSIISLLFNSKLCVESIRTICSVVTSEGDTLIHLAVQSDMFNSMKTLVEKQLCDPVKTNNYDQTPLHFACMPCRHSDTKIAQFLCANGCDVHKLDEGGHSPAFYALKHNLCILQMMITTGYCRLSEIIESVQWKVDYCHIMKPSQDLKIQIPLLHLVAYNHRHSRIIKDLMAHQNFSPNVYDSFENTVLHLKSFIHAPFSTRVVSLHDCDLNKQNKEGNTPLHIACAVGYKDMVKLLVETERCNESMSKLNNYGHTPLYYAKDRDIINYLIMNGADPKSVVDSVGVKYIIEMFEKLKGENPLNPTVTTLVLGNSMAGKTTLIKSVTKAYRWGCIQQPSIGQTKDLHALGEKGGRTAGVEISEYKVFEKDEVRILFHDFAGHPEFESTHSVLLQNLLSSSRHSAFLFLIVLDITQHDKLTQLMYWAKFIENCESSYAVGKAEVIIIGSHVDGLPEAEIIHKVVKDSLCKTMESTSLNLVENPILLDCREPKQFELQKVQTLLLRSTRNLKESADLDIRSHLLFAYLYEHFADKPVKLSVLQKSLTEQKLTGYDVNELSFTRNALIDLLKGMHYRQHILLIGLEPNSPGDDFWILTAKARSLMFQNVNGLLFASEKFDRHIEIKSNVGVLPSSVLKKEFPDVEYDLLQQFLEYSELCKQISDTETLKLIEGRSTELQEKMEYSSVQPSSSGLLNTSQLTTVSNNDECVNYFFFPGLVKEKRDLHVWKPSEAFSYNAGWSLECIENSFFNPLFLQVLLLRLIFQFAATSNPDNKLQRKCIIWKNGLFWSIEGVEMLVEVVNQNQAVNVLVRCFADTELEAVKLRSAILKEIFKVKEKHCPKTKTIECIICDPSFNDHGSLAEHVQKVAINEIVSAVIEGSPRVQDTSFHYHLINRILLCFEPYVGIGDELLTSLFDIDKANETVSEKDLLRIPDLQKIACAQSRHADYIMQQVCKPIVYHDLRKLFDMYSIFHGRNPKDLL